MPYVRTSDLDLAYLDDRLHLDRGRSREFGDAVADRIAAISTPARPVVLPADPLVHPLTGTIPSRPDYRTDGRSSFGTVQVLALHEPAVRCVH